MSVRITSYNVLCSHLCSPSHFRACKPENLDPSTRWEKVLKKLDRETDLGAICCLQEVSMSWCGQLHTYFASRGYLLIHSLYGEPYNNYMGVAIAFPRQQYELLNCEIKRVSDTKQWPESPNDMLSSKASIPPWPLRVFNFLFSPLATVYSWVQARLKPVSLINSFSHLKDPWEVSKGRRNTQILLRLRAIAPASQPFCVATYHMPCVFWDPRVIVIHTALSARHVQAWAGSDPYIFAGDFNFGPLSESYRLVSSGSLAKTSQAYPPDREGDPWEPKLLEPMVSAYASVQGREPDFTNYAKVKESPPFIETLDYVFCKPGMRIASCEILPHRNYTEGPLPNDREPSDHILIAAEIVLPPQ